MLEQSISRGFIRETFTRKGLERLYDFLRGEDIVHEYLAAIISYFSRIPQLDTKADYTTEDINKYLDVLFNPRKGYRTDKPWLNFFHPRTSEERKNLNKALKENAILWHMLWNMIGKEAKPTIPSFLWTHYIGDDLFTEKELSRLQGSIICLDNYKRDFGLLRPKNGRERSLPPKNKTKYLEFISLDDLVKKTMTEKEAVLVDVGCGSLTNKFEAFYQNSGLDISLGIPLDVNYVSVQSFMKKIMKWSFFPPPLQPDGTKTYGSKLDELAIRPFVANLYDIDPKTSIGWQRIKEGANENKPLIAIVLGNTINNEKPILMLTQLNKLGFKYVFFSAYVHEKSEDPEIVQGKLLKEYNESDAADELRKMAAIGGLRSYSPMPRSIENYEIKPHTGKTKIKFSLTDKDDYLWMNYFQFRAMPKNGADLFCPNGKGIIHVPEDYGLPIFTVLRGSKEDYITIVEKVGGEVKGYMKDGPVVLFGLKFE